jgi:hypothetical protein
MLRKLFFVLPNVATFSFHHQQQQRQRQQQQQRHQNNICSIKKNTARRSNSQLMLMMHFCNYIVLFFAPFLDRQQKFDKHYNGNPTSNCEES